MNHVLAARQELQKVLENAVATYAAAAAESLYVAAELASAILHEHARHHEDDFMREIEDYRSQ